MLGDFVSILQILFAGIAFALALLAYRLVRSIADQERVDPTKIKLANMYMLFAFAIGALAIAAQFFNNLATPSSNAELDSALAKSRQLIESQSDQINKIQSDIGDLTPLLKREISINYDDEPAFINLNGGGPKSNRCPEGYVITGASGWEPAGSKSLAIYKARFECRKLKGQ
ncbi:MAG: hypothetical protein AAFO28_04570 [Pseudomonadota bacterium]